MAEKLQSKVKLRSGEVVTIDHVKPSKSTPKSSKSDAKTAPDETKTPKPTDTPEGEGIEKAETKTPETDPSVAEDQKTNTEPKETK